MDQAATLIIGAGPAGLAVAGRLRQAGLPFEILERSDRVADAWHRHYDRLHLHTVKELSHLPGIPFPEDYPRYVPRTALAEYYQRYAEQHGIEPRFGEEVTSIGRRGQGWTVVTNRSEYRAGHVVLATGASRVPHRPQLPGEETFHGEIVHSQDYRNADRFVDRTVLVVGMGNTGAEIALDLCEAGVDVAISVRGPVNIVPRQVLGRPTQLTALTLSRLPTGLADRIGVLLRRLTVGDLSRYGIETPDIPPMAQLRTKGQTPVIDVGTVRAIKQGRIPVMPAISTLEGPTVAFADGRRLTREVIVLATGYRPRLEELLEETDGLLDENGFPRDPVGSGRYEGLCFVGFDNYKPGGILGTIQEDSARVADAIARETVTA